MTYLIKCSTLQFHLNIRSTVSLKGITYSHCVTDFIINILISVSKNLHFKHVQFNFI